MQSIVGMNPLNENSTAEVMTFYQSKRIEAVPIDTIEVEDDDEVQNIHGSSVR